MEEALQELVAEVDRQTTVTASVVTLLNEIADRLEEAADDPDQVRAEIAKLRANTDAISAAVTAHTPSAPTP